MTTPTLVTPQVMGGTGFLGAHSDEIYYLPADDLYLTGTSEVALAGYHADEILDLSAGPKRYMGWSTCYRREAGAAGKDTRGIIRVHQFNKAEMFSYCRPEDAEAEHARLLAMEEEMLALVELPYRVIDTAAGDLGSSAARKFDCEAWLPTQQRWMEVTSTSNCTTYQARRLAVRERRDGRTSPVATLNGTLATTRWMVAILENHQTPDGAVRVPEGLLTLLAAVSWVAGAAGVLHNGRRMRRLALVSWTLNLLAPIAALVFASWDLNRVNPWFHGGQTYYFLPTAGALAALVWLMWSAPSKIATRNGG